MPMWFSIYSIKKEKDQLRTVLMNLKKLFVSLNIIPVQEPIVTPAPVDHSQDIKSMKQCMNELEEALCCLKYKIKQLKSSPIQEAVVAPAPVEESSPFDLSSFENGIRCLKYEVKRLKEHRLLKTFHQLQLITVTIQLRSQSTNSKKFFVALNMFS